MTVILPSVGVRRHRIFLTERPGVRRLARQPRAIVLGPSIEEPAERPVAWALASIAAMLVLVLCACFAAMRP